MVDSEELEIGNTRTARSIEGIETAPSGLNTSWPNPDSIRTIGDYTATLRRTWLKAGSPSAEEIVRLSAGTVGKYQANSLIIDASRYRTWDQDDIRAVLVALEVFGLSDALITRWKRAGTRALRRQYLPRLFVTIPSIPLLGAAACFGAGIAAGSLSEAPRLGTGNWWAFGISSLLLVIVLIWAAYASFNSFAWGSHFLARVGYTLFFITCIAGFFVGWLRSGHPIVIHHISINDDIRNWAVWRF